MGLFHYKQFSKLLSKGGNGEEVVTHLVSKHFPLNVQLMQIFNSFDFEINMPK